jgi:hypothetical protein
MSPSSFPRLVNIIDQAALVEHLRPCVCVFSEVKFSSMSAVTAVQRSSTLYFALKQK